VGFVVGADDGFSVGIDDGFVVGFSVGTIVGLVVGVAVGLEVGSRVGTGVGAASEELHTISLLKPQTLFAAQFDSSSSLEHSRPPTELHNSTACSQFVETQLGTWFEVKILQPICCLQPPGSVSEQHRTFHRSSELTALVAHVLSLVSKQTEPDFP